MKAMNTLAPSSQQKVPFSAAITGDSLQNLIRKSVSTPESAARFTGTLISAVAANPQLRNCNPASVVAAALRGEGMGLSLGREYHLIPFGDNCAFVIGYKGLIALCLAGNDISDMDCIEVREGELIGRDKRTKRPQFDFSVYATDEEAAKHPVIGYYAYCEFASGRFRFEYMSIGDILDHAQRYSKAFDIDKYRKLQNGELTPQEAERLKSGSPYYSSPEIMFKKTVIRKLLNSGYIPLANSASLRDTISYDNSVESSIIPDFELPKAVDVQTGEVMDAQDKPAEAPAAPQEVQSAPEPEKPKQEPQKRGRPPKSAPVVEEDPVSSFFAEDAPL